ncbi:tpr repeat-containing protein [Stylonychia lemnae]|uniref:Tpr repeat-containing protein n=1 Tax=Stylonychia lemnae TaxID=5949 RepID=A0A078AGL9_STYLE|nr:tpr repeat-containing protein [Stylonychia lemnae]|eukprot:CDW81425.1 tpr repeat-containing protein [Stylonychia lemnae]
MVNDVINKKKEHKGAVYQSQPEPQQMNQNKIKNSLIQVIQTHQTKLEYEVSKLFFNTNLKYVVKRDEIRQRAYMQKYKTVNPNLLEETQNSIHLNQYPFIDKNCRKFYQNRKDQITHMMQQKDQTQSQKEKQFNNMGYEDIKQMNDQNLETFFRDNQLLPLIYFPTFNKKPEKQVGKYEFFLVKGNQYLHKEDYIKAMRFFKDGLKSYPGSLAYQFNIALVYFLRSDFDSAKQIYEELFLELPDSPSILYNLLLTLMKGEQHIEIQRYKDVNYLTRPRALMSQEHININKMLIYSASVLARNQVSDAGLKEESRNLTSKRHSLQYQYSQVQQRKLSNQKSLTKTRLKSTGPIEEKFLKFDDTYFRKRDITQHPQRSLRLLTQKREISLIKSNQLVQRPQKSMIEVFQEDYEKKKQKFDRILSAKRHVMKDRDTLYANIETNIIRINSADKDKNNRKPSIMFKIAPGKNRSSSLDLVYKQLAEVTKTYTEGNNDPIDEKYKELLEDLRIFKQRVNIKEFVQDEKDKEKEEKEYRERPWLDEKTEKKKNPLLQSKQMDRARSFIKSAVGAKNRNESIKIAKNIENLIDDHVKNIQEQIKGDKQIKLEKELTKIIQDLSIDNKDTQNIFENLDQSELNSIDKSFITRLEKIKDISQMTEDQKFMQVLGITKEDLDKRKEMQQDKLLNVLCPDGVTQEDRESFDRDTDEFLSYLYNNFLIKSTIVPGTEIPHLFRDSLYFEQIKKYLEKLSQTITSRLGIFGQDLELPYEADEQEYVWEVQIPPKKIEQKEKKTVYKQILKKGQELDGESTAKSTLAYLFLQKINTMGLLNKLVQDNMSRIKKKRRGGYSSHVSSLTSQELKYVEQQLNKQNSKFMKLIDYQLIDNVLSDLKFFSLFEKEVRNKIYKLGSYQRNDNPDKNIVDPDLELTKYMYVVLSGRVTIIKNDLDLGIELPLTTFKAGDCFGDLSIQSHTVNPYDILSKNKIYARADDNDDPCHLFKFEREAFIQSIFKDMKDNLYKKIMMLKSAEFFEDLSPYALFILASSVQVKEFKLGDIIIKQGTEPSECYIILEGECKIIYEKDLVKSTKVSKFAKKCLQSDIPKPLHFSNNDTVAINQNHQTPIERNSQQSKQMDNAEEKIRQAVQEQNMNKYSFQNEILKQDSKKNLIQYRHHVCFGELKIGNCVGYRTMLDKQIIRRHIIDECESYSEQLQINQQTIQQENFQNKANQAKAEHQNSLFKKKKLSNRLSPPFEDKEQVHLNLKLINEINEATVQVTDMIILDEMNQKVTKSTETDKQINAPYLKHSSTMENQAPSHIAEEITPRKPEEELLSRNQLVMKSRLYDRLMHELQKSQLTVVANTASVKVMVIRKEDKNFLNETLKNIIDRRLLEKRFRDADRPLDNIKNVLEIVEQEKTWKQFKTKLESDMLREVAMTRKINKLLD